MKPFDKPNDIPPTRVAIDFVIFDELESPESSQRRALRSSVREEVWFKNDLEKEDRRMMVLDALEVKMVQDVESDEESNLEKFEWNLVDFNEEFIFLQVDFDNPKNVGAINSEDFITVTFWGVDFFKSYQGIEVEFGFELRQRILRQMDAEEAVMLGQL